MTFFVFAIILTDQSVMNTREKIIEAAKAVFSERGYFKAKIDEIAERAGVAKGSIYTYFPSKADLFFSLLIEGLDALGKRFEYIVRSELSPIEKLEKILDAYLESFLIHREFLTTLLLEERVFEKERMKEKRPKMIKRKLDELLRSLQSIMEEGIREGAFRKLDSLIMALSFLGMCNRVLMYHIVEDKEFNPDLIRSVMHELFFRGILREDRNAS